MVSVNAMYNVHSLSLQNTDQAQNESERGPSHF